MKRYSVLTLAVLLAGLGLGRLDARDDPKGEVEKRLDRLEASMTRMDLRLAQVEGFVAGLRISLGRNARRSEIAQETNQLKQVAQCLIASGDKLPRLPDGTIDAYAIVRLGIVEASTAELLMKSGRAGGGPSAEEIRKGDYTNFPYHRGGKWCTIARGAQGVAPLLWEKSPDRDGKLVVAFNNGAVKYIELKELERMLAELAKDGGD